MGGWKDWQIGEVVTESDFQGFVQDQVVQVYSNAAARGSALGENVTDGMVAYMQDGRQLATYGTASGWSGVALSPNYIINGAFDIWQRGTSTTTDNTFAADRWRLQLSGATATFSQQTFTSGELEAAAFGGANFYGRVVSTAADDFTGLTYRVEDVRTLAGQQVTISLWAKADATRTLRLQTQRNYGSGGSATETVNTSAVTLGTTWQRVSATFTMPSLTGKTVGANSYLNILLINPNNQTFTFDYWGVQLEAGSVATPFRRNANSIQGELAACQRYFVALGGQTNWAHSLGFAASTTSIRAMIPIPVTMRATPTLVDATPVIRTGTSGLTPSATTMQSTQASAGIQVSYTVTGATANNPAIINHDATASLSAEL